MDEARRLYRAALHEFDRGFLFFYFGESDRTQHVFWRASDPRHPAYTPQDRAERGLPIEDCYSTCDELVGEAMEAADGDTTLIVLSDHGFAPFYRRFHLTTWLSENGYLTPGAERSRPQQGALSARWDRTTAYAVGLNGVYLNLKGREAAGIVPPEDRMSVARRLAERLRDVRDPATGDHVIRSVHLAEEAYTETIPERTPDLIVGYAPGYRCSSASAIGVISSHWIEDNDGKWSGDHCIDRDSVPGILTASRRIGASRPSLLDVAASVLAEFDVPTPGEMLSRPFW
jgi:predicted AlkP superfamily phosphohydrolase/phosphomutase